MLRRQRSRERFCSSVAPCTPRLTCSKQYRFRDLNIPITTKETSTHEHTMIPYVANQHNLLEKSRTLGSSTPGMTKEGACAVELVLWSFSLPLSLLNFLSHPYFSRPSQEPCPAVWPVVSMYFDPRTCRKTGNLASENKARIFSNKRQTRLDTRPTRIQNPKSI